MTKREDRAARSALYSEARLQFMHNELSTLGPFNTLLSSAGLQNRFTRTVETESVTYVRGKAHSKPVLAILRGSLLEISLQQQFESYRFKAPLIDGDPESGYIDTSTRKRTRHSLHLRTSNEPEATIFRPWVTNRKDAGAKPTVKVGLKDMSLEQLSLMGAEQGVYADYLGVLAAELGVALDPIILKPLPGSPDGNL